MSNKVVEYLAKRVEQLEAEVAALRGNGTSPAPGDGLVVKDDRGQRLAFGWWYQSHDRDGQQWVDWSGDVVDDPDEVEKAAYQFMVNRRTGDVHHQGKPVATVVESMVFTPEKARAMGLPAGVLPRAGWWGGMRIHDEQVWDDVRKGRLKAFSVGGRGKRTPIA